MMSSKGADWGVLAAILAMALATYAMRAGGFWLMGHVPPSPRLRRMLEALPGSVVAATVLPIVVLPAGFHSPALTSDCGGQVPVAKAMSPVPMSKSTVSPRTAVVQYAALIPPPSVATI